MLEKQQLTDIFDRLGTPKAGRERIQKARREAAVREVASSGGNVLTRYVSRKMCREIRTESGHIEFPAAVGHEFNPEVLEYYPQPCELRLELVDTEGGIHRIRHFPDFLVIREDGLTLEEWKSEATLTRLALRYPHRYQKASDGVWYASQIERQLADEGLRYRVMSDASLPRRRVENYLHLADYLLPGTEPCPPQILERVRAALVEHGALTLAELFQPPFEFTADPILKAVADGELIADLDRESLSEPYRCRLYRDEWLREFRAGHMRQEQPLGAEQYVFTFAAGARFRFDGQTLKIAVLGHDKVVCTDDAGRTIELGRAWLCEAHASGELKPLGGGEEAQPDWARYTADQLRIAQARHTKLQQGPKHAGVSSRTLRRWAQRQASALAVGANEALALVPNTAARGNRTARLTEAQEGLIERVFSEVWSTAVAANYRHCHDKLDDLCEAAGVPTPSYPTLIRWIKSRQTDADILARHGKRVAYQQSAFVDVLHFETPPHGSRPFQYVHVDHTLIDVEAISSRTRKALGRAWLTLVVDAFNRRVLAFYLTYDPPSYRSVMMAVRDLVRRHGRLPEFIITDNGADFTSSAFEAFLDTMGVHLRFRPGSAARHGAVLERLFGTLHTQYLHNLAGNTKAMKHVRMTTGKHLPSRLAEWTLEHLYYGIQYWATEYYDQEWHPALDMSPREAAARGVREAGARPQRQVLFNQGFLIATCPPVDRTGHRQVDRQRGVKVGERFYWSSELRDPRWDGKKVPVRYDPWDKSSAYVWLKERWVHARCRALLGLGHLSEIECRVLSAEYVRRHGALKADDPGAGQRLKEFLQTFTPEGVVALELEQQAENKGLYERLRLASVTPAHL